EHKVIDDNVGHSALHFQVATCNVVRAMLKLHWQTALETDCSKTIHGCD
ncbi:hypothetical protein RvY_02877, partial [Ramazzottius varieornatus]